MWTFVLGFRLQVAAEARDDRPHRSRRVMKCHASIRQGRTRAAPYTASLFPYVAFVLITALASLGTLLPLALLPMLRCAPFLALRGLLGGKHINARHESSPAQTWQPALRVTQEYHATSSTRHGWHADKLLCAFREDLEDGRCCLSTLQ